jgi:hypothetical protein
MEGPLTLESNDTHPVPWQLIHESIDNTLNGSWFIITMTIHLINPIHAEDPPRRQLKGAQRSLLQPCRHNNPIQCRSDTADEVPQTHNFLDCYSVPPM